MKLRNVISLAAILLAGVFAISACHSFHIETTVENRTGSAIRLLEVDYPSASFGADGLAAGATMHYRIQIRGEGPLKVQYTGGDGRLQQAGGPSLAEGQEGKLEIILLPSGKVEFNPALAPKR